MEFRQLLPQPEKFDLDRRLAELGPELAARATDRPYLIANFVASADGRASFAGRSGQLGDDGDRAMFHGLREQVDAVLVGTGTLRTENYGRVLRKPERRERRQQRGETPEPIACLLSRSGAIPIEAPLFQEPEARIVVFTAVAFDAAGCGAAVDVVRLDAAELTFTAAVRILRTEFGVRSLLCEGGPTVLAALVREGLVDELFLTQAPKLTGGGTGPTVTSGAELPEPRELRLIWALERNDSLFLRYGVS
jgi:riboflavin-specific deaminase-like protein